jgi:hypothetical protein
MRADNVYRVTISAPETSPRRRTPLAPPALPVCAIGTYILDMPRILVNLCLKGWYLVFRYANTYYAGKCLFSVLCIVEQLVGRYGVVVTWHSEGPGLVSNRCH